MTQFCHICENQLKEGEIVIVHVKATYHHLGSKVMYALDKGDMEAIPSTLAHWECVPYEKEN